MKKIILILLALLLGLAILSCNTPKIPQGNESPSNGNLPISSPPDNSYSESSSAESKFEYPTGTLYPPKDNTDRPIDITAPTEASDYEIAYLKTTHYNLFSKDANSIDDFDWAPIYTSDSVPKQKSLSLDGSVYDMTYDYSAGDKYGSLKFHTYVSNNEEIEAGYIDGRESFVKLFFSDYEAPQFSTEDDYFEWGKNILEKYGVMDLEDYIFSCNTWLLVEGKDSLSSITYNRFLVANAPNQEVAGYQFYFTRYIDGYPTTDKFLINLWFSSSGLTIWFDVEQFKGIESFEIDREKVEDNLKYYIANNIRSGNTLISCVIKDEVLAIINDRVCVCYTIEAEFIDENFPEFEWYDAPTVVIFLE